MFSDIQVYIFAFYCREINKLVTKIEIRANWSNYILMGDTFKVQSQLKNDKNINEIQCTVVHHCYITS